MEDNLVLLIVNLSKANGFYQDASNQDDPSPKHQRKFLNIDEAVIPGGPPVDFIQDLLEAQTLRYALERPTCVEIFHTSDESRTVPPRTGALNPPPCASSAVKS